MNLGCGLFGLAPELEKDFTGTLQQLRKAGFTAIEPLYAFRNDPALIPGSPVPAFLKTILWNEEKVLSLLPRLQEWNLSISSMHVAFFPGIDMEDALSELVSFSQKTGIRHFMTSLEFDTQKKCDAAIKLLNDANKVLNPEGIILGYHNHYMEFKETNLGGGDLTWMDYFLSRTSENVKLQLDTGWLLYGGEDVISFMHKYADRIISVHLKDFVPTYKELPVNDAFAAIGNGVLPTREILEMLPMLSLFENGLMIDQDHAAKSHDLPEDLKNGAALISRLLQGDK